MLAVCPFDQNKGVEWPTSEAHTRHTRGTHQTDKTRAKTYGGVCANVRGGRAWDVKTRYLLARHITKDVRTDSIRIHDFLTTQDRVSFASFARHRAHETRSSSRIAPRPLNPLRPPLKTPFLFTLLTGPETPSSSSL